MRVMGLMNIVLSKVTIYAYPLACKIQNIAQPGKRLLLFAVDQVGGIAVCACFMQTASRREIAAMFFGLQAVG